MVVVLGFLAWDGTVERAAQTPPPKGAGALSCPLGAQLQINDFGTTTSGKEEAPRLLDQGGF